VHVRSVIPIFLDKTSRYALSNVLFGRILAEHVRMNAASNFPAGIMTMGWTGRCAMEFKVEAPWYVI
jgi:hypothetical protein